MSWIRVDVALCRHPKVMRFGKLMGVSRHEALGMLLDLWTWATDYTENGDLTRYESDELMQLLGINQNAALIKTDLLEALVTSGFVDREGDNLLLHDWDMYQGQLEAQRKANRDRQRKYRQREKDVTVTNALPDGATQRNERNDTKRTVRPADRQDEYVVLEHEGLTPITEGDCKKWRELFPSVDLDVELEKMYLYLEASPKSKKPKASLPRFALNWLQRASKDAEKDKPISDREQRRSEQRNKEAQAQMEDLANLKRASTATIREARKDMAEVFEKSKWQRNRENRKAASE
mgnify:CR=1 FL=1|jgi:hypothetical protein